MKELTTEQYIKVSIANAYGLDKENWEERITAVDQIANEGYETYVSKAKEPMQFIKGWNALNDYRNKTPSGFMMSLDATASGLQIMAVLSGCMETAMRTNLVDTGNREDAYELIGQYMGVERDIVKGPTMTHYYGSKANPKKVFKGERLKEFYQALMDNFPGAELVKQTLDCCWQNGTEHYWKMPDGFPVIARNLATESIKIPLVEDAYFGFVQTRVVRQRSGISLPAHVIHSIDAYIAREMVRKLDRKGIQMLPIHDCFYARPQHMGAVRQCYQKILMELADSDLLQNLCRQITGQKINIRKLSSRLSREIAKADYFLS